MTACRPRCSIPTRWRRHFRKSAITRPFPFNGYYDQEDAPDINGKDWKFEVRGLVDNTKSWTLEELYKLPQVKQVTRHICVEGWSAIGKLDRHSLKRFPEAGRRRHACKVLLVPVRRSRRLQQPARHGEARCIRRPR